MPERINCSTIEYKKNKVLAPNQRVNHAELRHSTLVRIFFTNSLPFKKKKIRIPPLNNGV